MDRPVRAALVLTCLLASCQDEPASGTAAKATPQAVEGAMCAEHGVLEAVCTKCNPKLAAVF